MNTFVTCGACGLQLQTPVGQPHGSPYSCPRCRQPIGPLPSYPYPTPPLVVTCPHCRHPMSCDPRMAGQVLACPHCRGPVVTPSLASANPAAVQLPAKDSANEWPQLDSGAGAQKAQEVTGTDRPKRRLASGKSSKASLGIWIIVASVFMVGSAFGLFIILSKASRQEPSEVIATKDDKAHEKSPDTDPRLRKGDPRGKETSRPTIPSPTPKTTKPAVFDAEDIDSTRAWLNLCYERYVVQSRQGNELLTKEAKSQLDRDLAEMLQKPVRWSVEVFEVRETYATARTRSFHLQDARESSGPSFLVTNYSGKFFITMLSTDQPNDERDPVNLKYESKITLAEIGRERFLRLRPKTALLATGTIAEANLITSTLTGTIPEGIRLTLCRCKLSLTD